MFQSKAEEDDRRINQLEKDLKEAREKAEAADATYEEVICEEMVITLMRMIITDMIKRNNDQVAKKLATCEADLEKAEDRAEVARVILVIIIVIIIAIFIMIIVIIVLIIIR